MNGRKRVSTSAQAAATTTPSARLGESVTMDRCGLASIPSFKGKESVQMISLQHNLIARMDSLSSLHGLIVLNLYGNKIERISGLEQLGNLRVLMLGKNRIKRIEGLNHLERLDILDLHGNQIITISNLNSLKSLRVLNLAANSIRKISGLENLASLQELNLRRNHIVTLTDLSELKRLERLYLSNNKIQRLENVSAISHVGTLLELSLDGNPIALSPDYVRFVVSHGPTLLKLDDTEMTISFKREAIAWMANKKLNKDPQISWVIKGSSLGERSVKSASKSSSEMKLYPGAISQPSLSEVALTLINARRHWDDERSVRWSRLRRMPPQTAVVRPWPRTHQSLEPLNVGPEQMRPASTSAATVAIKKKEFLPLLPSFSSSQAYGGRSREREASTRAVQSAKKLYNQTHSVSVRTLNRSKSAYAPKIDLISESTWTSDSDSGEEDVSDIPGNIRRTGSLDSVASSNLLRPRKEQDTKKNQILNALSPRCRDEGKDYLLTVDNGVLQVAGLNALRPLMNRTWPPEVAYTIHTLSLQMVHLDTFAPHWTKLKQWFPNLQHLSLKNTHLNTLSQLSSLASWKPTASPLLSLDIEAEGNLIFYKPWKAYAVYRLGDGLRQLNKQQVDEDVKKEADGYRSLESLIELLVPTDLACTSDEDTEQPPAILRDKLTYKPVKPDDPIKLKAKTAMGRVLENTVISVAKVYNLRQVWPQVLEGLARDTLQTLESMEDYKKQGMENLQANAKKILRSRTTGLLFNS